MAEILGAVPDWQSLRARGLHCLICPCNFRIGRSSSGLSRVCFFGLVVLGFWRDGRSVFGRRVKRRWNRVSCSWKQPKAVASQFDEEEDEVFPDFRAGSKIVKVSDRRCVLLGELA